MKKEKILFVVFGLPYGGTTTSLISLIKNLKSDFDITVFSFWNEQNIFEEEIKRNVKIQYASLNAKQIDRLPFGIRGIVRKCNSLWWKKVIQKPERFMVLYNLLQRTKYKYEVGYTETEDVIGFLNNRKSSAIKYQWIHTDIFNNLETQSVLSNLLSLKNIQMYISVSDSITKNIVEKFPQVKVMTQYNIFSEEVIVNKSKEYDVIFDNEAEIHLVAIGRLSYIKGYDRLARIHHNLLGKGIYHYIHIVGDNQGQKAQLEELITELGIGKTFLLEGGQENPYPYFKSANGLIISSYSEGLPTVAIEAQLLECPILSTDVGGIKEIVQQDSGIITLNDEIHLEEGLIEFIYQLKNNKKFVFDSQKFTDSEGVRQLFKR